MKVLTKFCLILSGILILLGLAGIGASFAMGLRPAQLLNLAHYPEPFGLPRLEILDDIEDLTDEMWDGLDDMQDSFDDFSDKPEDLGWPTTKNLSGSEEHYEYSDISRIDLSISIGHLEIHSHDGENVIVEADNAGDTFRCQKKDTKLILEDKRKTKVGDIDHMLSVYIYLPEQTFKEIDVSIGAGNVALGTLNADILDFSCGTGNFTAESLTCHELDISSGVGNIDIDLLNVSKEVEIELGAGNITINAEGRETDYNYELSCTVGDICLNRNHCEESSHHSQQSGFGNHFESHHGADRDIEITLGGAGNLELNFTDTEE